MKMSKVKMLICPSMSGKKEVLCIGDRCAIWHETQKCAYLVNTTVLEDISIQVEELDAGLAHLLSLSECSPRGNYLEEDDAESLDEDEDEDEYLDVESVSQIIKGFICPSCEEVSTGAEWDGQTTGRVCALHHFICPKCEQEVHISNISVEEF